MKLNSLILVLLVGCSNNSPDPRSEDCKCRDGSFFSESGECKVVLYIHEPCLFLPEERLCGCDGMNYANRCFQHQAGVKIAKKGMCPN